LTICYGPRIGRHLTYERKRMLRERYFFECNCLDCKSGDDDFVFRHNNCNNGGNGSFSGFDSKSSSICKKCKSIIDSKTISDANGKAKLLNLKLESLQSEFDKGGMTKVSPLEIMNKAIVLLQEAKQLFIDSHRFIGVVCDFIVRVHTTSSEFSKIIVPIDLLKKSIEIVGINFGKDSIEFANESFKSSTIIYDEAMKHKQFPQRSKFNFKSLLQMSLDFAKSSEKIFKKNLSKEDHLIIEVNQLIKEIKKFI